MAFPKRTPINQAQISNLGAQWNVEVANGLVDLGRVLTATHLELALADAADLEFLLQASSEEQIGFGATVVAGGDATVEFFNQPTFSAAGTDVPFFNRNNGSGKRADSILTVGPTITDDGTQVAEGFIPAGIRNREVGGAIETGLLRILAAGTAVLLRLTNISGAAQNYSLTLDVIEIK